MRPFMAALLCLGCAAGTRAQGNYEVQVYASDLVSKGVTMVELHSNFTASGSKTTTDGTLPTNHQVHETVEITHGFNEWFETGFYQFTSIQPDGSWEWVGTHIRPRFAVPERYKLPVGISISNEIGYQRPLFSADTWTWEIRPIVDKKIRGLYLAFNPTFDKSFHGPSKDNGFEFSPNIKFSYDVTKKVALGMEYYGAYGPVTGFDPLRDQQQQIIPAVDIDFGKNWEFNFGVGIGVTQATDHLLVKAILGYRFHNRNN
ncbi:MAG TPA: transporter [Candidatus Acidoferrales bacterium]|nr:transporter [Candidatus Acidoferrales bacterium]